MIAPDTPAAVAFLKAWLPEGPWTVICDAAGKWSEKSFGYFTYEQEQELTCWLDQHNGQDNIYFVRNIPRDTITTTPKKDEILALVGISLDVDLAKKGATQEEYDSILARLRALDCQPTVIVFTGGGYQAHWRFSRQYQPSLFQQRAEDLAQQLAHHFGGDAVQSISSLMRLPGTVNVLNDTKRQMGREPLLAYVIEADWSRTWDLEAQPKPELGDAYKSFDTLSEEWQARITTGSTEWLQGKDRSRSTALFLVILHLLREGWPEAQVEEIILNPSYGISESVREKDRPQRYAKEQINHAKIKIAQEFVKNDKGKIIPNHYQNIKKALTLLEYSLTYDEFADRHYYHHPTLASHQILDDKLLIDLRVKQIPERFHFQPPDQFFKDAVPNIAREHSFHPVFDYLAPLNWDGKPRIETWLIDYAGAEDTPYARAVSRLILIAAVCRIRCPGCKFDEMLVLQSPKQGTNKSSAIALMAVRPEWFTDSLLLGAQSREALEQMLGKWLVEFSDLAGMRRRSVEELKKFLAQQYDRARLAYGRLVTERPRSCVFFGTTNSTAYLQDETNRRFWPISVHQFDLSSLAAVRDQLWAEAAHYQAQGTSIRLSPELYQAAALEQARRRVEDPFLYILQDALGDLTGKVVINDLWPIIGKPQGNLTFEDNRRIGEAIRELGWSRKHTSFPGRGLRWCYVRGDTREEVNRPIYVERDPITQQLNVGYDQFQQPMRQPGEEDIPF